MTPPTTQQVLEQLAGAEPPFHHDGEQEQVWHAGPATLGFIAEAVQAGDRTVETGAGASTVVFAAAGAHHTAISPEPAEHQLISRFCDSLGVPTDRLEFLEGYSEEVLPACSPPNPFDFAFIDGKHCFPYPILDWHYLSRHLRVGGTLLMDDVQALAVQILVRRMLVDQTWGLRGTFDGESFAFKKLAEPPLEDNWQNQVLASREELERHLGSGPPEQESEAPTGIEPV